MSKPWADEEKAYVLLYYYEDKAPGVAKVLGRSAISVQKMAHRMSHGKIEHEKAAEIAAAVRESPHLAFRRLGFPLLGKSGERKKRKAPTAPTRARAHGSDFMRKRLYCARYLVCEYDYRYLGNRIGLSLLRPADGRKAPSEAILADIFGLTIL